MLLPIVWNCIDRAVSEGSWKWRDGFCIMRASERASERERFGACGVYYAIHCALIYWVPFELHGF